MEGGSGAWQFVQLMPSDLGIRSSVSMLCAPVPWRAVGGREILPVGGHETARWWPSELPTGGHEFCPR